MKTRILVLSVLLILLMNACIVKSLHQFYNEEDVIYEEVILGTWIDDEYTRWVISPFTYSKGFMKGDTTDNSYLVELYEDSLNPVKFNVHLFEVEGKKYLDFKPIQDDHDDGLFDLHLVPTHSLAMIDYGNGGKMTIRWFEEEWLNELFEENRVKIAHEVIGGASSLDQRYVLTASTDELQKFILKYGNPHGADACEESDNFMCARLTKIE